MTTSGLLAALIAGSLFTFNVGPNVQPLHSQAPPAWVMEVSADSFEAHTAWWALFNDPVLNACVEQAFQKNADLEIALARVEQARAALGTSRSFQAPTLDVQGSTSRGRVVGPQGGAPRPTESDANLLVGSLSYEADLFGRLRKGTEASRADWEASRAARDGVRLVLAGQVARTYFTLRSINEQLHVAKAMLAANNASLEVLKQRYQLGMDSEMNYQRFRSQTATVAVQVKQLEDQLVQVELALLVLLGYNPVDLSALRASENIVALDKEPILPKIPTGLPAEMLNRRPDLRGGRERYIAAVARVGQANAARYPSLSLNALLGAASGPLQDLFSGPTGWSLTGQVLAPIFDAGRRKSQMQRAEAVAWEARVAYEQQVRVAFQETLGALSSQANLKDQGVQLEDRVESQKRAFILVEDLYRLGRVGQFELLDAQRQLLQAQLELVANKRDQLNASVNLCLSLGGGWDVVVSNDLQLLPVKGRYKPIK